jgi:hypothetical protein
MEGLKQSLRGYHLGISPWCVAIVVTWDITGAAGYAPWDNICGMVSLKALHASSTVTVPVTISYALSAWSAGGAARPTIVDQIVANPVAIVIIWLIATTTRYTTRDVLSMVSLETLQALVTVAISVAIPFTSVHCSPPPGTITTKIVQSVGLVAIVVRWNITASTVTTWDQL